MPDDKVNIIIEIMKGLQALYNQNEKNATLNNEVTDSAMGIFNKYANTNLIPIEKTAWGEALKAKYADH